MARGLCKQGTAQAVCAFCFLLLASSRYSPLQSNSVTWIILFIQWQVLGLTISKLGAEQTVFATVSRNPGVRFDARRHVLKRAFPLALVFALPAMLVFPVWTMPIIVATIAFDTWSLLLIADNNARGNYGVTAAAKLLNYPLFFLLLFVGGIMADWSLHGVLIAFCASSIARWLFLVSRPAPLGTSLAAVGNNLPMGFQQALNYGLFRLDEVLLAAVVIGTAALAGREYVFQARFPHMISMLALMVGVVLFPHFYLVCGPRGLPRFGSMPFRAGAIWITAAAGVAGVVGVNYLYRLIMWDGECALPELPFILHACAILPVNMITYSMLRQGCLRGLLRNLLGGVTVGIIYLSVALSLGYSWPFALCWLSAVQLYAMIALSLLFNWGKSKPGYV